MNDPIKPRAEELQNAEVLAFEKQLRSLSPRAANFQVSEQPQVAIASAIPKTDSTRSLARRTAWAATLLVTWSLGAAAGIVATVAYLQPHSDVSMQDWIVKSSEPSDLPQTMAATSSSTVEDSPTARPSPDPAERTPVQEPNPFVLAFFPGQASVRRSGDAVARTPLSRSTRNIDFGYSDLQPAKFTSSKSSSVSQQDDRDLEPMSPIVPVKLDASKPANQRDMLRSLLDTYGAVDYGNQSRL